VADVGNSYSWRNATIGSTRAARRAGKWLARAETNARTTATDKDVSVSVAEVSYNRLDSKRDGQRAGQPDCQSDYR